MKVLLTVISIVALFAWAHAQEQITLKVPKTVTVTGYRITQLMLVVDQTCVVTIILKSDAGGKIFVTRMMDHPRAN